MEPNLQIRLCINRENCYQKNKKQAQENDTIKVRISKNIAVLEKVRYAQCPVWRMPCLANALFGQCPMPYALCPMPYLSEKGYI